MEATTTDNGVQYGIPNNTAEKRRDNVEGLIPPYVEDVQDMLPERVGAHPVQPARKNPVRRTKTAGRRVSCVLIGSKRNNVKNISTKRIQQLIDEHTDRDRQNILHEQVNSSIARKVPGKNPYNYYHVPTPKGIVCISLEEKLP